MDLIKGGQKRQLDLDLFLSNQSEDELILLQDIINKIISKKQKKKEVSLPISIFSQELNPAEALVKCLKENKKLRLSEISKLINKNSNAVWLNYKRAIEKKKELFILDQHEEILLPIYIFKISNLSYLESIVMYLRDEKRFSNNEIANLLKKSPQVLSIAYNRARSKLKNE